MPGLERFERDRAVAIIVVSDHIDIMTALHDRQIGGPVIGDPAIGDGPAWVDRVNLVRTAPQRWVERGFLEIAAGPVFLRQDRHLADDLRQFAVLGRFEGEADTAFAILLDLCHVAVIRAVSRMPFLAQRAERPDDVIGRHLAGRQGPVEGICVQGDFDPGTGAPLHFSSGNGGLWPCCDSRRGERDRPARSISRSQSLPPSCKALEA